MQNKEATTCIKISNFQNSKFQIQTINSLNQRGPSRGLYAENMELIRYYPVSSVSPACSTPPLQREHPAITKKMAGTHTHTASTPITVMCDTLTISGHKPRSAECGTTPQMLMSECKDSGFFHEYPCLTMVLLIISADHHTPQQLVC